MSVLAVPAAILFVSLAVNGPAAHDLIPECRAFEAKVGDQVKVIPQGQRPHFTLTVRNTGHSALRLLDTRHGRRTDLADTYFRLIVNTERGVVPDIPEVISDPGPIADDDYFALDRNETAQIPITSPLALEALSGGAYVAHVVIWVDPFRLASRCRSSYVDFLVQSP